MKKTRFLGKRSPTSRITHFSSVKCNELKYCESRLEYDRLLQLEFDPYVKYYEAQPDPIFYTNDKGKEVCYTPDLKVVRFDESFVIEEVKPYEISIKEKVERKHALIASIYDDDAIAFTVVTEKDIYLGKSNENHRKLYRYLSEPIPKLVKNALTEDLAEFRGSVYQLREELNRRNYAPQTGMLLLAHGLMKFNIEGDLSQETEVVFHG